MKRVTETNGNISLRPIGMKRSPHRKEEQRFLSQHVLDRCVCSGGLCNTSTGRKFQSKRNCPRPGSRYPNHRRAPRRHHPQPCRQLERCWPLRTAFSCPSVVPRLARITCLLDYHYQVRFCTGCTAAVIENPVPQETQDNAATRFARRGL